MTTETFAPTGQLLSRTTLTWGGDVSATVDMDKGRVQFNPQQRRARKQRNRQQKAGRRASR